MVVVSSCAPLVVSLLIVLVSLSVRAAADTPVVPNASKEAQALLAFLHDTYGRHILAGQQDGWRRNQGLSPELRMIQETSGKLPALLGFEAAGLITSSRNLQDDQPNRLVTEAIDWSTNRNGIVTFCWHWNAPLGRRAFYTAETDFSPARAATPGTPDYEATLADLDRLAGNLKRLHEAGVPVLWRPLHEANGRWFWWGAGGPDPFKKLWRIMFERLTVYHQLNNLIWVFSPGASIDLGDWYPGDAYVDIIAPDHYPMDGSHDPAKGMFDEMVALSGGAKLVGFGENGPIPSVTEMVSQKAGWLFFIAWSGRTFRENNTTNDIQEIYNHPYVLSLKDLPELKAYPFKPAGSPAKLAFVSAPPDLAVGSPGRRAIVVAVQDAEDRTVREGDYSVKLTIEANPGGATLNGNTEVTTVNGLAVFQDVSISKPGKAYSLRAATESLRSAVSPQFNVGPGNGITREYWTNSIPLAGIAATTNTPASSMILGKAFEAPFNLATNFTARHRGYVIPPLTGEYVFWVANEGLSELWLSQDESPDNKVKIAEVAHSTPYVKWPHTHEAQSQPVHLEAGRRYYLEAVQRQNAGSTHISVRWRLPDGTEERPIPGAHLATLDPAKVQTKSMSSFNR